MPIFMRALSVQYERGWGRPQYTEVRLEAVLRAGAGGRAAAVDNALWVRIIRRQIMASDNVPRRRHYAHHSEAQGPSHAQSRFDPDSTCA